MGVTIDTGGGTKDRSLSKLIYVFLVCEHAINYGPEVKIGFNYYLILAPGYLLGVVFASATYWNLLKIYVKLRRNRLFSGKPIIF
jgi:hypothetical protein